LNINALEVQNLHCWHINFKTTLEIAEKHKHEEKNREADSTNYKAHDSTIIDRSHTNQS
jgi:hypothetical protein